MILLAAIAFGCYTNHAGLAVSAVPVRFEPKFVTLSNRAEVVRLPQSVFPESELRRMACDYAEATGDCSVLRLPADIRRAIEGNDKAIRRSQARAEKGLCTSEESQSFVLRSKTSLQAYLKKQQEAGRITPTEHNLLSQP